MGECDSLVMDMPAKFAALPGIAGNSAGRARLRDGAVIPPSVVWIHPFGSLSGIGQQECSGRIVELRVIFRIFKKSPYQTKHLMSLGMKGRLCPETETVSRWHF